MPRLQADLQGGHLRGPADDAGERPGRYRDLRHLCHRRSAPRRPTSSPIRRCSTACWSPRAIRRSITGINTYDVRRGGGREHRLCRGAAGPGLAPKCKAEGKPEPTLQLYDNNANCIQAILAGRADTYVNDVNTVDQAVKANPDKLEKAVAVTMPYSVGIAVPKDKPKFRDAVMAALIEIQKSGTSGAA